MTACQTVGYGGGWGGWGGVGREGGEAHVHERTHEEEMG